MDSQVDLAGTATTSVKLDQVLKNNASKLAKKKGITFTELIRRLLEEALEKDALDGYQNTLYALDGYLRLNTYPDGSYKTLNEFIMEACKNELYATSCPNCGTHNSPDSLFCKRCGTRLKWESPYTENAEAFFAYYSKTNPTDKEHEYYLSPPAYNSPDCPFTILIHKIGTTDFKIAKIIDKNDLQMGEKILMKYNKQ